MNSNAPGRTGDLPCGWHRVTWTNHFGKPRYVVTECISSAVEAYAELYGQAQESSLINDVALEHWEPACLNRSAR